MFKHILMPTDGSEHSERAIERGVELAKLCGARVTGIHVLPDYRLAAATDGWMQGDLEEQVHEEARSRAQQFLEFVESTASAAGVQCETVIATNDRPYNAIVEAAIERKCDLIVMTSRQRGPLASVLMRNEATHVLHRASIPVLTFRAIVSAEQPAKQRELRAG